MSGTTAVGAGGAAPQQTGLAGVLGINDDQLAQLQKALQSAGSTFGASPASSNYMRAGVAPQLAQGQPNNLMSTILQMRANQAAAMGQPYQAGVAAPATSLLR